MHKPIALIILDGWGHSDSIEHNAIAQAHTPFFDKLWKVYPHSLLDASEEHVGLPTGQMGNSEIGHMTIGCGKVIDTDLVRISKSVSDGTFDSNPTFQQLFHHVKKHASTLHIYGLVSPGGIHSHRDHLYAFLRLARNHGIAKIAIHAFTDGRDTPPQSAAQYLHELEDIIEDIGIGRIATVSGRFYAMDRDKNWDRIDIATNALFRGVSNHMHAGKASDYVAKLYKNGALDEHIEPIVFLDDTGSAFTMNHHDGIFIFNFRADRSRQITKRLLDIKHTYNLCIVSMTDFDSTYDCLVAYPPVAPEMTLASVISSAGLSQAHIAETEKYAHVTYFFNGGREQPHEHEKHILIDSRKDVRTHDLAPEMRCEEITNKAIQEIMNGTDALVINFANADMVGHTAVMPALLRAIEYIDAQLQRLITALDQRGGIAIITADHGNAETTIDPGSGIAHTAHTTNKVPCIITDTSITLRNGTLADIAPTLLELLDLDIPIQMTGTSLIK